MSIAGTLGKSHHDSDQVFEDAARWQIRLRDPAATTETQDAFLRWVGQDPRHLAAYDQAEALWNALADDTAGVRDEAGIDRLVAEGRRPSRRVRVAAAACAIAISGLGVWQGPDAFDSLRADHIAWTGERSRIVLADGSIVEMNSGTAIAVDLDGAERHVRVFRGEAFFDVAPNRARPFIVQMPEGEVRVTGTSFNVDLTQAVGSVSLLEGAISLSTFGAPGQITALLPGQRATIASAGIGSPEEFDAEHVTAWRQGRMVFYRTPLREVLTELGRYRRGSLILMNDAAADLPVTGAFSTDDTGDAIAIITETLGLSVHNLAGALTIIR